MRLTNVGGNVVELETDNDYTILFSYGVPVAMYQMVNKEPVMFVTTTKHSNTTSKHINAFRERHNVDPDNTIDMTQGWFNSVILIAVEMAKRDPGLFCELANKPSQEVEREVSSVYFCEGKVAAIKRYRILTGAGLKDSKDYVEGLPCYTGFK